MAELTQLTTPWDVDRHIVLEAEKLVLIRFSGFERPPDEALSTYVHPQSHREAPRGGQRRRGVRHSGNRSGKKRSRARKSDDDSFSDDADSDIDSVSQGRPTSRSSSSCSSSASRSTSRNEVLVDGLEHYVQTQQIDEVLLKLAPKVRKYCTIYTVSTLLVPEFNIMYELGHERDPFALMFFYRNQHIRIDSGTGNHNKINFVMDEDDLLLVIDAAYRAGKLGKTITSTEKRYNMVSMRR